MSLSLSFSPKSLTVLNVRLLRNFTRASLQSAITHNNTYIYTHAYHLYTRTQAACCTRNTLAGRYRASYKYTQQRGLHKCMIATANSYSPSWHYSPESIMFEAAAASSKSSGAPAGTAHSQRSGLSQLLDAHQLCNITQSINDRNLSLSSLLLYLAHL